MASRMLELAIAIKGSIDGSFTGAMSETARVAQQVSAKIRDLNKELRAAQTASSREMKATGSVSEATQERIVALQRELNTLTQRRATMQEAIAAREQAMSRLSSAKASLMSTAVTTAVLAAPLVAATKAAMDFESSMADVRKVVDFDTPQQFKDMNADILQLSQTLPMAAEDIARIVAAGGQSGIAREDLMAFAEDATKMGIAFDVTAEQAGDMMAKWRTAFKMNQAEVVRLADQINYLGNTTAASAPIISDIVTRIGPLGEIGGVSSAEISALGASMAGVGVQSDIAATGIKNFILGMVSGEGATKSQNAAFSKLGMNVVDVAQRMQVDAKGAILDVLHSIQNLDKAEQATVLKDLFGKESIGAISPLLNNLENLESNFDKVADAAQYAGSMEAEYAARSKTTANQMQLTKNTVTALAINIGSALLPAINNMLTSVVPVVASFAEWASKHEDLVKVIVGLCAALAGLVLYIKATAVISAAYIALSKAWTAATVIQTAATEGAAVATRSLTIAQKLATFAQWAWNAALLANPVGLVIAGIVALGAAVYLLYKNFDKVREFMAKVWESPIAAVLAFTNPLTMLMYLAAGIISNWETVKQWFTTLWEDPKKAIGQLVDFLKGKFNGVLAFVAGIGGQISAKLSAMWESAKTSAMNFFASLPGLIVYAIGYIAGYLSQLPSKVEEMVNACAEWLSLLPERCYEAGIAFVAALVTWLALAYIRTIEGIENLVTSAYEYLLQLPAKSTEAGAQFVETARQWASDAYTAVMEWITKLPEAISDTISNAWSSIKTTFSSGFTVGVQAASNADGGIYRKGAFLTTFAERSPEAAIPLDGSARAVSLWEQAGNALGMALPESSASPVMLQAPTAAPVASFAAPPAGGGDFRMEFNPNITINGNTDAGTVEQLRAALLQLKQQMRDEFSAQYEAMLANNRRLSYE